MAWFRENLPTVLQSARRLKIPHSHAIILLDFSVPGPNGIVPSFAIYSEHALPTMMTRITDWVPAGKMSAWFDQLRGCIDRRATAARDYLALVYVSRFEGSVLMGCFMLPLAEIEKRGGVLASLLQLGSTSRTRAPGREPRVGG
jgi:hypothetical protein